MRNPIRTEAEAFSFVVVVATVGVAIGLAAWLGGRPAALGVVVGIAVGVVGAIFLRSEPKVREAAVWDRPLAREEQRRVLVIANETCGSRALLDEIGYRARGRRSEVLVVAPALPGHGRLRASDADSARDAAKARLGGLLAALAALGIDARGEVGDADPVRAIEDALRTFGADEIVISTHPQGRSSWLERNEVARARERFPVPVAHVVVDLQAESATPLEAAERVSPSHRPRP